MIIYNNHLAQVLGISEEIDIKELSGNKKPSGADPIAQAYAGHQFGQLNILGDGRAVLLGEHITPENSRFDIQLKGSGRTPYSRNGDGRGTLYSMLREYLISHSMEKLGIKTTKSLAVVSTGQDLYRNKLEPGAILTRVASSHIRVGTFQYVAMQGDLDLLKTFADYVISRHYPNITKMENPYLSLLKEVMLNQITLITDWLRVGFIHGVMNTDNVSISGETIDYGPCAFMDIYNPDTVFSSIDRNGRYSYKNQENLGGWNIARFAETLIPLIDKDTEKSLELVNTILSQYKPLFRNSWLKVMGEKLGLKENKDSEVIDILLNWMFKSGVDYTKTFRDLSSNNFLDTINKKDIEIVNWYNKWSSLNIDKNLMKEKNPAIIPRNHIVEDVLKNAVSGNMEPFKNFMIELSSPYSDEHEEYFKLQPKIVDTKYKTFCGT